MKNAGCTEIALGIESADQDILKNIAKGTKVDKAKKIKAFEAVKKQEIDRLEKELTKLKK